MSTLHVVFGAGQVGALVARILADRGHRVRVVRRSARGVGPGIEVVAADAGDPAAVRRAAQGAAVLYHCLNASYTARDWQRELPRYASALVDAAIEQDARLVCLDNLYAYGPRDEPLTEGTALAPAGPKARVRAELTGALAEAARTRGLRYAVGRAGDFFGPGVEQAVFSGQVLRSMRSGSTVSLIGDPTAIHAFSYVKDVAAGLVALGTAPSAQVEGQSFHLPVLELPPAELHRRLTEAMSVRGRYRKVPRALLWALSPFVPLFRELPETLYQWEKPFRVDDSRFRRAFPGIATPLDAAIRETAASA